VDGPAGHDLDPREQLLHKAAGTGARNDRVTTRQMVPGSARLASFESWSRTISGILKRAGVKGLLQIERS